jgi:hypothetical protein
MARVPGSPETPKRSGRRRERHPVIQPEGRFIRSGSIHVSTERSPSDVTSINPDDMKPILPEMPYIPPA